MAIKSLKTNEDIIILPSDKSNTIVILNKNDYIQECERQLSDTSTYARINKEQTSDFQKKVKDFIKKEGPKEDLDEEAIALLTPPSPRTPIFYILPKTHKPQRPPPGRPIVSSYGSPTERISALVDENLQPLVKLLPSHLRDSQHLLSRLQEIPQPLPTETILVTIDVESLYTNIPHQGGLDAAKHFLDTRPPQTKPSSKFLCTLIQMVLTMNNFKFLGNNYLQCKGTAMGTRMAPSYANLFMGLVEQNFLSNQNLKPTAWFRFIDDIFMVWQHGMDTLQNFLTELNNCSCLNFTWTISSKTITYLDLDIFLEGGILKTKIHVKKTNKMQYLHYSSCHPAHVKKSIPKSLAIKAKSLCSDTKDYNFYLNKLNNAFTERGYPQKVIKNQFKRKKNPTNPNNFKDDPKFITSFFPGLHKMNSVLKTGHELLKNSSLTEKLFSRPPRIVFKKPQNLKNMLVRPKLADNSNSGLNSTHGCEPCKKSRCGICKIMCNTDRFQSNVTNKVYPIVGHMDCTSNHAIYQLSCRLCPKQYIGQTSNSLRVRMTGHRFSVNHKETKKPVALHAVQHDAEFQDCFDLKAIHKIVSTENKDLNEMNLRTYELAHQLVLKSKQPYGLNIR